MLQDPTCRAFDYTTSTMTSYLHRVPHQCAGVAGATFLDGTEGGSTFYELVNSYRL